MDSITSMSMQQGGLGLILIVSAPPMAAAFFQGMLGQFSSYNQMAVQGAPQGVPASGGGAAPNQKSSDDVRDTGHGSSSGSGLMPTHMNNNVIATENTMRASGQSQRGLAT